MATRRLTPSEYELARWMLEHGTPEAIPFLEQLARADATTWRCFCGCASFNFKVRGEPDAPPGVNILAEFIVGEGAGTFGVFIFQSGGILSGVEVYALGAAAPATLPEPRQLRPVQGGSGYMTFDKGSSQKQDEQGQRCLFNVASR